MSTTEPYFGEPLTPSEREVLALVCEGLENREICARLYIGYGTVKVQIRSILAKLGAKNRTHAAVIYVKEKNGSPCIERTPRER